MADKKFNEMNEKIAQTLTEGYKKIEDGVVTGYKKIEDGVVTGYKKIEDGVVEGFGKMVDKITEPFTGEKGEGEEKSAPVAEGLKKIEDGVVGGYKKIEESVVGGFNKLTDGFVDKFFRREGETVEEAKARLEGERGSREAAENTVEVNSNIAQASVEAALELSRSIDENARKHN